MTRDKKLLVQQLKSQLPPHIFDGSSLYSGVPIYNHDHDKAGTEFTVRNKRGNAVKIKMKLGGEIKPEKSHLNVMIYNSIIRLSMEGLGFARLGRDFLDHESKQRLGEVEIMHGFKMSARIHELGPLINCDQVHNLIRTDTVYQQIRKLKFDKKKIAAKLIGNMFTCTLCVQRGQKIDSVRISIGRTQEKLPPLNSKYQPLPCIVLKYRICCAVLVATVIFGLEFRSCRGYNL